MSSLARPRIVRLASLTFRRVCGSIQRHLAWRVPPRYVLRRVLQIAPLILGVVVVNFLLIHLTPGDPAAALAGDQAPAEYIERMREEYGLNEPVITQLGIYLKSAVTGDLGYSFSYRRPVAEVVSQRLAPTLLLVLAAEIPAIAIGTFAGAYFARNRGRWHDRVGSLLSLGLYSIPVFWSGMMLILFFAIRLGWFPTSGMVGYGANSGSAADIAWHLVLPTVALMTYLIPNYIRISRASVIEVMKGDYLTTARAVGFPERTVFYKYALRNALLPTISAASVSLGLTFSGALLVETVFAWPGMGQLMFNAVFQRDYPVLMGAFLLVSVCVAVISLVADIAYAIADPRVRYD